MTYIHQSNNLTDLSVSGSVCSITFQFRLCFFFEKCEKVADRMEFLCDYGDSDSENGDAGSGSEDTPCAGI